MYDVPSFLNYLMDNYTKIAAISIIVVLFMPVFLQNVSQYKKATLGTRPPFTFLLFLTGYLIALPFGSSTLFIFKLYRNLVNLVLKIKHGSEFRGLLDGADAIFTVEGVKNVINVLMVCEYDEVLYSQSPYETTRQALYNLFFHDPERYPKFLSSFHKSMGYSFMLKNEMTIDDCVRKMKILEGRNGKLDKEDVMGLVTDCSNAPLPKNGTVLWEVLIGTQPINWNKDNNNETNSYPVMFRVHHGVADGVSLIKFLVGALADNPDIETVSPEKWKKQLILEQHQKSSDMVNRYTDTRFVKEKMLDFWKRVQKMLDVFLLTSYVLCLAPTTFFHLIFLKANDRNFLQGPLLSGQVILALNTEVSQVYVNTAKKIKNRVPGAAFSDVVLTAFSGSLNEYFVKNTSFYPRNITIAVPVLSGASELKQLTPGKYDVNLQNKFSLLYLNLPLHIVNDDKSKDNKPTLRRLKMVQAETTALRNSIDYVVNHWILSVGLGLFPLSVVKFFIYLTRSTVLASVLPGPPKVTLCGGSSIKDVAFWVPHMGHTGVSFSALSYDGRLQIGLNVDKALISDKSAAESILNGVYKYIDILDEETSQASEKSF